MGDSLRRENLIHTGYRALRHDIVSSGKGKAVEISSQEHSPEELRKRANNTRCPRHRRPLNAIAEVIEGEGLRKDIAARYGVGAQTLCDWVHAYNR